MSFPSILFKDPDSARDIERTDPPGFFRDLNLDQVIDAVVRGREEYNLRPFFYSPLKNTDGIEYRHEVMRDLENEGLYGCIKTFAAGMRSVREHLDGAEKLYYEYQKQAWFLSAVDIYCNTVVTFAGDLSRAPVESQGFAAFRDYLGAYVQSGGFKTLMAEVERIRAALAAIRYCLEIEGGGFSVRKYDPKPDYSEEVQRTFQKFRQGAVKDYRVDFSKSSGMNHIEAVILGFVARLNPEIFSDLSAFCTANGGFRDEAVVAFDREIQFYAAYLEYIGVLRSAGLKFCYPIVSGDGKEVYDCEGFDLALAHKLCGENSTVVCNDFFLKGSERVFVVTGPNQGGKTTFARTFGQLHYLDALGCPVPGSRARLHLFDEIFTHFEKEEDIRDLRGKLEDDLVRIRAILDRATPDSIVIMNEIFTSTTLKDAVFLSRMVMGKIAALDALCVWVTFIDEMASFSDRTVSMVSGTSPENPALRTFKITRRPADGLSYAMSIAEKYGLTHDLLKERIRS